MSALLDVIIPVFLIIGCGYCSVWTKLFSEDTIDGLMSFTQNFAIPVLLFDAIAKVDLVNVFDLNLFLSFYFQILNFCHPLNKVALMDHKY